MAPKHVAGAGIERERVVSGSDVHHPAYDYGRYLE